MNNLAAKSLWDFLKQQYSGLPGRAKVIVYFILLLFFVFASGAGFALSLYLRVVEREASRVGYLIGVERGKDGEVGQLSPDELKRRGIHISTRAKSQGVSAFYDNDVHQFAVFSSRLDISDAVVQFIAEGLDPDDPTMAKTKLLDLRDWLLDRPRKLVLVPRLHLDTREFELHIEQNSAEREARPGLLGLLSQERPFGLSWAGETQTPVSPPGRESPLTRALFEVVAIQSFQQAYQKAAPDSGVYLELEVDQGIKKRLPRDGRIFLRGEQRFVGLATGIPWPPPSRGESAKIWIVSVEQGVRQDLTVRLTLSEGSPQTVEHGGLRLTYRISGPYELRAEIDRLGAPDREARERTASTIAIVFGEEAIESLWKAITYAQSREKDMAIISTLKQIPCRSRSKLERTALDQLLYKTEAYRNQKDYNRIWQAVIRKPNCT